MFNNQTAEIDLDEDEVPEKDDFFEKNNAYEFSMKLPVKTHIYKIEVVFFNKKFSLKKIFYKKRIL